MTGGGARLPVVDGERLSEETPGFQRIAVVGLGAVGGSLAAALRRAWPAALVIGVDTAEVIETAIRMHAVDVGSADLMIAGEADLVVLAGGADENARAMLYLAEAIAGEAVVLVVGDAAAVAATAPVLPDRLPLVAGLPGVVLRGSGIHASSVDLFRGRRWTVTSITAPAGAVERIHGLVRAVGADPSAV